MTPFYNQSSDDALQTMNVNTLSGLTTNEVNIRKEKYGTNELKHKRKKPFLLMFIEQFKSFMVLILMLAAVVSGITGYISGEGFTDTFVILGILIVNALIGAVQERKAESSLEALQNMSAPQTKVRRNGNVESVSTIDLVPGDIVILETGDIVPADIRLTNAINLKVQESAMTGESLPVEKIVETLYDSEIALGDRVNMAFTTGLVTYGRGEGVVVATGMNTEVGKIASMLQDTEKNETPMSRRLEQLGKTLGIVALVICTVIFGVGVLYGNEILHMFMTAVSLAVAAIPEGLPAISTVVLAIGVQRLVKRNAIIRTLPSVETLGSATVICSDKTGTLTQNKMTVKESYFNSRFARYDVIEEKTKIISEELKLFEVATLCTDAHLTVENKKVKTTGDPTETALVEIGYHLGLNKNDLEKRYERVAEIPFDSERKRMTTVNQMNGKYIVHTKGGLDEILQVTSQIRQKETITSITPEDIETIHSANNQMASKALRVLALAYKVLDTPPTSVTVETLESDLIFVGLVGMIDPARPEVIEAVKVCQKAGIRPVMITGDHKITATAIAQEIGMLNDGDKAVTGTVLEKMSDEELFDNVENIAVYARVAPEHKVRIVKAWQKHDEIVAMTGDGVNDAPALKQADIGAAMGIVGTEVAKDAADMILTDDNFATIVTAVKEGRRIYDNILKSIQFLLSSNIGEVLLLLIASIVNIGTPLLPIHILWVNLVTDSFPALALSVDPAEENIMERNPVNSKKGFLTKGMIWRIAYQGTMMGILPLITYVVGALIENDMALGRTMAFATLSFAQLFHVRNLHSKTKSSFLFKTKDNPMLIWAMLTSFALMFVVLLLPPIAKAFDLVSMDLSHWLLVMGLSIMPVVVVEIFKLFKINTTKDENS